MGQIRLAELLSTLSFAGDLGRGQSMGHVLRTTRIAMALADRLHVPSEQLPDVYFTGLLVHAGCTAGAANFAAYLASDELSAQIDFCLCDPNAMGDLFGWMRRNVAKGQPLPARVVRMLRLMAQGERGLEEVDQGCSEAGSRIASRMGMPEGAQLALYHICESWSGKGPHKLKGDDIPLAGRIVNVAMIVEVFVSERSLDAAREAARTRSGKSFDPAVAEIVIALCGDTAFWDAMREEESWSSVLDLEPAPVRYVDEGGIDAFCTTLADFIDLKSATASTHSRRTAEIAEQMASRLGLPAADAALTRRAALVHDIGMVGVPSFLMEKDSRWSESDYERYRLHPYYTERVLAMSEALRAIGEVAASHHECIDGSGFHRRLSGAQLSVPARIVGTASAFVEASEADVKLTAEHVIALLKRRGGLDPDCLEVLTAEMAGVPPRPPRRQEWPSGLTEREVEVLRLIASGLNLKQAASKLVISDHTARHHLESVYGKAGVSSRAGITLFAVENGLLNT